MQSLPTVPTSQGSDLTYYLEYVLDCLFSSEVRDLPPAEEVRSWKLSFELLEYLRVCVGRGYIRDRLVKEVSPEGILDGLRAIVEDARGKHGQFYAVLAVAEVLSTANQRMPVTGRSMCRPDYLAEYLEGDILEMFDRTERAILYMYITCYEPYKAIALALGMSVRTVDCAVARIKDKIDLIYRHHMRQYDPSEFQLPNPRQAVRKRFIRPKGKRKSTH